MRNKIKYVEKSYKKRNGLHVVRFGEAKKNIKKKIHQSI